MHEVCLEGLLDEYYWHYVWVNAWALIGMCHRAYCMGYEKGYDKGYSSGATMENRRLWAWWDSRVRDL